MRTFFQTCDDISKMRLISLILISFFIKTQLVLANEKTFALTLPEFCVKALSSYKSYFKGDDRLIGICKAAQVLPECQSIDNQPIFHIEKISQNPKAKKILVFSLIHGDESYAGVLGRYWLERLSQIDARNSWRIVPVLNPDGANKKTRVNARGIDLNRNFPTADWSEKAVEFWKKEAKSSIRKFPGDKPGSEPEVICAMKHIDGFSPDFVVSIHTPLNVLDFDGPSLKAPTYSYLPWRRLGNFPGSLGRLLWVEKSIPVLTTELKDQVPSKPDVFEQLQDLLGTLTLQHFDRAAPRH